MEENNQTILRAKNLKKDYKKRQILKGISLEIKKGEIVGLLGPNGSGKTTTFNIIAGLISCDNGSIHINDLEITEKPIYERAHMGLSYLTQESSIFKGLTVEENMLIIAENLSLSNKERKALVKKQLEDFNLEYLIKSKAELLSGGEKRRLEMARIILLEPNFILMDEPFAGVDPIKVIELKKWIYFLKEKGIGILITDHNARELLETVERSYIIYEGTVLSEGSSEAILNDSNSRKHYFGDKFTL